VELAGFGEGIANFREARNDATAVTEDGDRAAFPVTLAGFVGVLELTEQGVGYFTDTLIRMIVAQTLDAGNKTRPGRK